MYYLQLIYMTLRNPLYEFRTAFEPLDYFITEKAEGNITMQFLTKTKTNFKVIPKKLLKHSQIKSVQNIFDYC